MRSGSGAWDSALLDDMIMTEPVLYRFGQIKGPTLLIIGDRGVTAPGKDLAPPAIRQTLGHHPELGHAPQMQDPDAFGKALIEGLAGH